MAGVNSGISGPGLGIQALWGFPLAVSASSGCFPEEEDFPQGQCLPFISPFSLLAIFLIGDSNSPPAKNLSH